MGKTPLGRPGYRWEDKTKINFQEVGFGDKDWTDLSQDRDKRRELVKAVMNSRVPYNMQNELTSWGAVNISGRTLLHGFSWLVSSR
jgi:acyl-homoserine lactone acylase PvdQ